MKILSLPLANDPQQEECAVTAFANTLNAATITATQSLTEQGAKELFKQMMLNQRKH